MIPHQRVLICFSVNLVSAYMNEPLDLTSDFTSLQKDMRAIDIVFGELKAVSKGVVDMGLGCEVHDCVNGLSQENEVYKVGTTNISLDELEIWGCSRRSEVLQVRTVIKLVQNNNFVVRVVPDKPVGHMGCNEASSSSYEDVLGFISSHIRANCTFPHTKVDSETKQVHKQSISP